MLAPTVGLKTHIWNNNLRCILLLTLYPLLLLAIVWAVLFAIAFFTVQPSDIRISNTFNSQLGEMVESSRAYGTYEVAALRASHMATSFFPTIIMGVAIWFLVAWFFNTNMIRKLSHSHPVTREEEPELYNLVENLCISQGVTMPRLEIIETHARNAFASGIDQRSYSITVTRGLMNSLRKDELEGVLAHELTHILNRDVRLLIVAVIFTGIFGFAAQLVWSSLRHNIFYTSGRRDNQGGAIILVLVIAVILWLGYIATLFMRFAISRRREFMADAGAVEMTKNPDAMMRALMRISGRDRIPQTTDDIAMMCIENHVPFLGLFATHPPIENRIAALSRLTNTPIPDASFMAPAKGEEKFTHNASSGNTRPNPWLVRQRRN